ncbi:hypothetical protein D3C80_1963580 [compost metagenome]
MNDVTSEPTAATVPTESNPKIAGKAGNGRNGYHSGKCVVTFFRFGIKPLASTFTRTS